MRGDDWWIDTSISYLCCHVACHKCALVLVNLKCQNQVVCVPVLSQSGPFTPLVVCVLQWFNLRKTLSFFMIQNSENGSLYINISSVVEF